MALRAQNADQNLRHGEEVFAQTCTQSYCHGANGAGTQKAPALANIRKNKFWTPAKITDQIQNGGQKMPPFSDSLTDAETAQVVVFLRSKHWPIPPPAAPAD